MLLLQRILFALMWLNGSVFSWTTIPSRANVSQTQPNGWPGLTRAPRARRETPDAQCFICLNDRYTPACASSALYSATPSTLPANVTVAKCKHGCLVVAELGTRYPGSAPREISSVRRTCGDNWGWIDYTGIFNLTLPRSGFMCMHAAFGRHSIVCRCSLTDYCNGRITERDIYTLAYEMPNPGWEIYFNYNPPAPLPLADSVIPANNPVGTLWCISCGNCVLSNATQLPLGIKRIPCRHGCSIRGKYYGVSDMIGKFMSISRGCGEDQPNFDLLKGMDLRYPLASTFLCTRWINTIAKVPTYLVCRCVEHNCNWQLDVPELKTMGTEYPPNSSFLWPPVKPTTTQPTTTSTTPLSTTPTTTTTRTTIPITTTMRPTTTTRTLPTTTTLTTTPTTSTTPIRTTTRTAVPITTTMRPTTTTAPTTATTTTTPTTTTTRTTPTTSSTTQPTTTVPTTTTTTRSSSAPAPISTTPTPTTPPTAPTTPTTVTIPTTTVTSTARPTTPTQTSTLSPSETTPVPTAPATVSTSTTTSTIRPSSTATNTVQPTTTMPMTMRTAVTTVESSVFTTTAPPTSPQETTAPTAQPTAPSTSTTISSTADISTAGAGTESLTTASSQPVSTYESTTASVWPQPSTTTPTSTVSWDGRSTTNTSTSSSATSSSEQLTAEMVTTSMEASTTAAFLSSDTVFTRPSPLISTTTATIPTTTRTTGRHITALNFTTDAIDAADEDDNSLPMIIIKPAAPPVRPILPVYFTGYAPPPVHHHTEIQPNHNSCWSLLAFRLCRKFPFVFIR